MRRDRERAQAPVCCRPQPRHSRSAPRFRDDGTHGRSGNADDRRLRGVDLETTGISPEDAIAGARRIEALPSTARVEDLLGLIEVESPTVDGCLQFNLSHNLDLVRA
jgi:hypothetical protein